MDGHADVWALLADGRGLAAVVRGLAAPWADAGITHVGGLEARGFAVGAPAAVALAAGFVPVREGLLPGRALATTSAVDYRGVRHELHVQAVLGPGDRVLPVDDWAQPGSRAEAAAELVHPAGCRAPRAGPGRGRAARRRPSPAGPGHLAGRPRRAG